MTRTREENARDLAHEEKQTTYLGDGVYAEHEGYFIAVFTSDGYRRLDTIYFEPEVLDALVAYQKQIQTGTV